MNVNRCQSSYAPGEDMQPGVAMRSTVSIRDRGFVVRRWSWRRDDPPRATANCQPGRGWPRHGEHAMAAAAQPNNKKYVASLGVGTTTVRCHILRYENPQQKCSATRQVNLIFFLAKI
jgi:hypothetical protein